MMMNDDDIKKVQMILKRAGYYIGAIDGKFGPLSRAALDRMFGDYDLQQPVRTWRDGLPKDHVNRIQAFLDGIAFAEGTIQYGNDNGYDVLVGGTLFKGYEDHPRVSVNLPRLRIKSTAAGRYQILSRFWDHYKKELELTDFGHDSQDRYAIQQIREQGAFGDVVNGDFNSAIRKCSNIWASFPGAGYGQREVNRNVLVSYMEKRLANFA